MPSCHSTNDIAHELLAKTKLPEGALIITERQTAGKGQRGNTWESEANKNITCSIILNPHFVPISDAFTLNIISSLAVWATLRDYILKENIRIKWPNDIYLADHKICGILIENSIKGNLIHDSIVGIGININQEIFNNNNATSLLIATGKDHPIAPIVERLMENLEFFYLKLKEGAKKSLMESYLQVLYWINEEHLFLRDGKEIKGIIRGIEESGKLKMQIENSFHLFDFKEVQFLR